MPASRGPIYTREQPRIGVYRKKRDVVVSGCLSKPSKKATAPDRGGGLALFAVQQLLHELPHPAPGARLELIENPDPLGVSTKSTVTGLTFSKSTLLIK